MSSYAFAPAPDGVLIAWETAGQVYWSKVTDAIRRKRTDAVAAPGVGRGRKHPVVAANETGETLLVWTEGTGWQKGGSLAWQVFDAKGEPTAEKGTADGVPVWSFAAAFARPDGKFVLVH